MKTIQLLFVLSTFCGGLSLLNAQTLVSLETPACRGKMQVFAINGVGYYKLADLPAQDAQDQGKQLFTWNAPDTQPRIYFIGTSMRDFFPILVGVDPEVRVEATCGTLNQARLIGSPSNVAYQTMLQELNQNNASYTELSQAYSKAEINNDEAAKAKIIQQMVDLDEKKRQLVETNKKQNPFLGRIAAVNTYISYLNADKATYQTGLQHYLATIWQFTDFQDEGYNHMNVVYEASANFANTLLTAMSSDAIETASLAYVNQWPAGSVAKMYAMGGMYGALSNRNNPAALPLAEALVTEYKEKFPGVIASVEQSFNKLRTSTPGAKAPDFSGPSPSGETIALSDLKGKVVLLDFWASWCGPCRKENPNVVKMYEKYADKGFEILGVSLDRDKARWEKAIADDGLTWLHISDLKHWQSQYASLYGVRSIPDTILLDAEGKIIARSLRGDALEQRLAQIFAGK